MSPRKEFEVLMYESEYRQIQAWVDKYQHLETGGDLFGLWADDHTAVVQLVLGPGKGCRRSSVSFYQDVEYLDRVGNLLTHEEGLCHIGEWHSHHRLGLSRPSGGDENTVWTNMDRYGIHRFFLFIATINRDVVNIGCFLFEIDPKTEKRKPVLEGKITDIRNVESPFRERVRPALATGAESQNSPKSLEKFAPKNAKIGLESRKITNELSARCHNERPTTNTPVHEEREKGERAKRQVKNKSDQKAFLLETLDQKQQQESRDRVKNIEENLEEIQNNNFSEKNGDEVTDNQEPKMPKLIQKENFQKDGISVIHIDHNKPKTVQDQPLISQINNEGDIEQNESSPSGYNLPLHSTQGYNENKDQANIQARNGHDKPNAEEDQVQSTVHENLPEKDKMDAKDSNGSETIEQKFCKEIRPVNKSTVIYVESVKSDDLKTANQRKQTYQPKILNQDVIRKENSQCESQQNSRHESLTHPEVENKDAQQKGRRTSSQISPGTEAEKVQHEPTSSVPDQDSTNKDEKQAKCWSWLVRKMARNRDNRRKQKKEKKKKMKKKENKVQKMNKNE